MQPVVRRIVYRHTAGPYPGLRQILGIEIRQDANLPGQLTWLHTGVVMSLEPGPMPDKLVAIPLQPDGRHSKALRLVSKPGYSIYQESPVDAVAGSWRHCVQTGGPCSMPDLCSSLGACGGCADVPPTPPDLPDTVVGP